MRILILDRIVVTGLAGLFLIMCGNAFAETVATPESTYARYCSVCHGDKGDGRSHAVQGMEPPPRDFTAPDAARRLTRNYIIEVITDGKPGTAMTSWRSQLTTSQIESLADYIRLEFMRAATGHPVTIDGKGIYDSTCSVCHGDNGAGAVWGRTSLNPPPVNFTRADPAEHLTRERMLASVSHGRPGTAMTAFSSQLTQPEIAAVVDYIRNTFMKGDPEAAPAMPAKPAMTASTVGMAVLHGMPAQRFASMDEPGDTGIDAALPRGLSGHTANGKPLYQSNCTACHGSDGNGNGPRAYFIFPKPRNFLLAGNRARLNRPTLFNAISNGVSGREMPAWSKVMTDQQIADIAEYVFQAFIENTGDN